MAASGLGSLVAALWLAFGGTAPPSVGSASARSSSGWARSRSAASQPFALSLLLMVAVGFGAILMAATANTTIQLAVPDGLRGRVMSVYTTIFAGSTPIGGPMMGGLASAFGVAISLAVGGVCRGVVGVARSPGSAAAGWTASPRRAPSPTARGPARSAATGAAPRWPKRRPARRPR